ncbi:reverse transcriptase domain-containing protein [Tanacetum coccineum]
MSKSFHHLAWSLNEDILKITILKTNTSYPSRKVRQSRLCPYYFIYPERSLAMEEMLNKFIDEGKREYDKMRAFIYDFQTNNELLFKERNNSLIELSESESTRSQELLANEEPNSFLSRGLEKSIDQSDLEFCEFASSDEKNGSDSKNSIRRIDSTNTSENSLLQVLERRKGVIAWKISNIKGINPSYCTHKILMEDDYKPVIQPQRRLNLKVQDVVKNEIVKLLDSRLIYPISDSSWDYSKYQSLQRIKKRLPSPVLMGGLCNAPATFQRCMTTIFHDMVEDFMEVFMDDFSVFGNSFDCCLANLDRMLARCEETNLVLNWKKCHFMVKEEIVLGHKISGAGIEVDRAKIDVIAKLPYPTNTVVYTDQYLFNKKDAKPRLIRLKNLDLGTFTEEEIIDEFPNEQLMILNVELNNDEPWYTDYVNYIVRKIMRCWETKILESCGNVILDQPRTSKVHQLLDMKVYESGFYWPSMFKDAKDYVMRYDACQRSGNISSRIFKKAIARFGVPIFDSDRGTHFCNSQLEKALQKYGVTHKLSTAYYPQINGQTEVTNRAIKRILERSVRYNPNNWSEKLDDALWAFRTAYKIPTGCTPFRLVYRKAYNLPVESKHKAY